MSDRADPPTLTTLARLPRGAAIAALVLIAGLAVGGVVERGPAAAITTGSAPAAEDTDWELYRAVLARIQAGDGYYVALGSELRSRDYPTRSVFNWRTPLHLSLLGHLPTPVIGQVALVLVALLAACLAYPLASRAGGPRLALATVIVLLGAFLPCVIGDIYLFSEVWAGTLIVCSALLLAHKKPTAGVCVGITALFFRELALLHCVVALGLALRGRRRKEIALWLGGLLAWAIYMGVHASIVSDQITATDLALEGGWVRFNGLAFVLASARMHAFLLVLPTWVTALYVPLALLGLTAWPEPRARALRLTGLGFAAAFAVIGRPSNFYWGPLYVPLLAMGIVWAPAALRDLVACALGSPKTPEK